MTHQEIKMSVSEESKVETEKVWQVLEKHAGPLSKPSYPPRRNCRMIRNGKGFVRVQFSKYYDETDNYWYGLNLEYLRKWRKRYDKTFIIFALHDHNALLIIPINLLEPLLNLYPDKSIIKLHLEENGGQ